MNTILIVVVLLALVTSLTATEAQALTFSKENITEGFQETNENLAATLLRSALENKYYETNPELMQKIVKGAFDAYGIVPNTTKHPSPIEIMNQTIANLEDANVSDKMKECALMDMDDLDAKQKCYNELDVPER